MGTPRERARERTLAEIRELAWQQVEQFGAASLSLRAIARELGVVSSAIYRYVPSRDDLLTALLIEGFIDLAEAVDEVESVVARGDYRERWLTIARAMRAWALQRPSAWGLLYGGPVPGYSAPQEQTRPPGTRVLLRHSAVILEAAAAGRLTPRIGPVAGLAEMPAALRAPAEQLAAANGVEASAEVVAIGILGWTMVLGLISAEIFEHLGPAAAPVVSHLSEVQLESIADALGL